MGYRQGVRQRTLTPSFRWFESSYPNHVGMDFTPFKKPGLGRAFLIRSVIPPSPQKYWQFWVWSLWNIKMDSTPFKKFGFWQCAAFCMKLNNIFALLFPASTLFSPLFFKLIFLRFFLFPWRRKENCVTINPKKPKKRRCIYAFSLRNRLL